MPQYKHIAAALNWAEEHGDESGLHLQPEEATSIDTAMGTAAANATAAQDLVAANATIKKLEGEAATATTNLTTAKNRITELEAENKKLGGEPSGTGTKLVTTEDEAVKEETGKKTGLNSPDHPLNKEAARRVAAAKARK